MKGFSDSLRRFKASTRKRVRDFLDNAPDAVAAAPPQATALNEPEAGGLSSSDTLKGDIDPKDGLEIRSTASPKNPFPTRDSQDTQGELNDTCLPAKAAPEPTHHRHLAAVSARSLENYQNRDLDGQKDDEARKKTASKKASHADSTNENETPLPAFDSNKGREAHQQSPPNQDSVHIEAKNKHMIQKASSDGQEIKGMVVPTLPLPPQPLATAQNLPASSVSSFTDHLTQLAAGSADVPLPAIGVIPPTPPAANNSSHQGDVLWNSVASSAGSRASASLKQRGKGSGAQQSKPHAQADGPTIPELPPASTRTSVHRRASSSSGGASKNVSFAEESSLVEEIPNYYQSSASDRPPSRSESNSGSLRGIIKQQPKHMQGLVADTPVVYLVISERATTEDCGPWEQVVRKTEGVYFSEDDANNKVVSMYNEKWEDVAKYASISVPTRQGSPFYRWETPKMVQGRYFRVLVEQHSVKAVSNEPKVWPKVRSLFDF